MKKQLDTELILIYGKQRHGKTMLGTVLSCDRLGRLFGNIDVKFKGISITTLITDHKQFLDFKIGGGEEPGYMLIDEIGKNFNSKKATSKKNEIFSDFVFLQGKFNFSTIGIAQRWSSIPVDLRELATKIFEVKKIHRSGNYPVFKIIQKELLDDGETLEFLREDIFDMIGFLKERGISYDTLATSIID